MSTKVIFTKVRNMAKVITSSVTDSDTKASTETARKKAKAPS